MNKVFYDKKKRGTLGTFAGVFTPSILTILGIILFLRLGYVVGNAGLGLTLLILCLANGISILTSVSLSAIATNLNVKGGGDYYLISRTLGIEFGGAIGIAILIAIFQYLKRTAGPLCWADSQHSYHCREYASRRMHC